MNVIDVDGMRFEFPTGWVVTKPDDWAFYRNQFARVRDGIKSVDILTVDTSGVAWFVEVKDYRLHSRTKPSEIDDEVAGKVLGTLAMVLAAGANANNTSERDIARKTLTTNQLRIVVHLEQPKKPSRLRREVVDPASLLMKLKKRVKAIDPHPRVVDRHDMRGLQWTVS